MHLNIFWIYRVQSYVFTSRNNMSVVNLILNYTHKFGSDVLILNLYVVCERSLLSYVKITCSPPGYIIYRCISPVDCKR